MPERSRKSTARLGRDERISLDGPYCLCQRTPTELCGSRAMASVHVSHQGTRNVTSLERKCRVPLRPTGPDAKAARRRQDPIPSPRVNAPATPSRGQVALKMIPTIPPAPTRRSNEAVRRCARAHCLNPRSSVRNNRCSDPFGEEPSHSD